jgi:hypothetical protein
VAVTASGALQLTIQQVDTSMACGEVFLDRSLGLGDYIFTVSQQGQQQLQELQQQQHYSYDSPSSGGSGAGVIGAVAAGCGSNGSGSRTCSAAAKQQLQYLHVAGHVAPCMTATMQPLQQDATAAAAAEDAHHPAMVHSHIFMPHIHNSHI